MIGGVEIFCVSLKTKLKSDDVIPTEEKEGTNL
jgi:hypothetical protein